VSSYNIPRYEVLSLTVGSRFYTGPLRSPNRIQNTFANESFIDEIAATVKADPIAFRLQYLTDQRLMDVFETVAHISHWNTGPANANPGSGRVRRGQGVAGMQYEGTGAYAAVVTHVDVDTKTGAVRVPHVFAAQDCGIAVNPNGMESQAQGCVIQGISRALKEELQWTASGIQSKDWLSYPILTFEEMPETFRFEIIDRPDQPALGAGEVVITAIIASIANAIHDATGARVRRVPFTKARVLAALQAAG
jgi:CO/xanthine dehydrogenase Mo-binding subunit